MILCVCNSVKQQADAKQSISGLVFGPQCVHLQPLTPSFHPPVSPDWVASQVQQGSC